MIDPAITAIIQPVNKLGNYAVEILLDEMEGRKTSKESKKILKTELVVRKSCGI